MKVEKWLRLPALLVFLLCMTLLCGILFRCNQETRSVGVFYPTVVLDAGHGGEDGGATDARGRCEKDLNLAIVFLIRDYLKENGVPVILTRADDSMLYDKTSNYAGSKKRQDLERRVEICKSCENPIFVSIHMNSFPQSQYHGLQVWYSGNNGQSKILAESIQNQVKETLQPENERAVKKATDAIFVLQHLNCPAVLVECGFLSNPKEAEQLQDPAYQKVLAKEISLGILKSLE
ncbi:MAG: N-acetylmuramoyl-L-alanine amidase [Clostridia bacterium]|nr:N-acetylmuramoyl-L-alanine amidase [Clostridia bacterium]